MNDDKLRDYLKRVTSELQQTRQQLGRLAARDQEPIAIVGMSCRYPGGVATPEDLWDLVATGTDAVGPFPGDRGWDLDRLIDPDRARPGTSSAGEGGFIDRVADFDPAFFGISPREALAMDPQQRLLLETTWESLERAGIEPATVRGSRTAVFAGLQYQDYGARLTDVPADVAGYVGNGSSGSIASGRVAYLFGFEGPTLSVDTACSSSLVALHLAVRALRRGEATLALAGGSMVMSTPVAFTEMTRQNGLAADGRCKSFSADADGTGWGEGIGMLLLEPLSAAQANGHPVLALVRGTAVNQDGASSRLTAPNGPAQQRVIRAALADAGLGPADVDVVEAHGTGTALGDPIEAQSLLATYGREHSAEQPLLLGSLKSNIGHTQAAAGVGGVIKMVMAMHHGQVPPSLHAARPTPQVDWSAETVRLVQDLGAWPETGRPRRAAVSSFGVSGTNGHVVLEEAPAPETTESADARTGAPAVPLAWLVSGRGEQALRAQADQLEQYLAQHPELHPADVAHTLATGRAVLDNRAAVVATGRDELLAGLRALADGRPAGSVLTGTASRTRDVVFVFPGQGSQWAGMARDLLDAEPVFAARMAECEQALKPHTGWSLSAVIRGAGGAPGLDRVDVVQPALFAVMVSLAALWRSAGVEPAAVVGHSQGEIAAACVAGALSLEDAAAVVALRSRALRALAGRGGMLAVALPVAEAQRWIADDLALATVNGPGSVVVSGTDESLTRLERRLSADGVRVRRLEVDYASHGPQVAELETELAQLLAGIRPLAPQVPFYSALTGAPLSGPERTDAGYWYRNLRMPVRFDQATQALLDDGFRVLLEVSPHPVLISGIEETATAAGITDAVALGSLRRDDGGPLRVLTALADLHVHGAQVDRRSGRFSGERRELPVRLPFYAFQRQRYWLENSTAVADVTAAGLTAADHPLLGAVVSLAGDEGVVFSGRISAAAQPWLTQHVVQGTPVVPGTALLDLAVRAGDEVGCDLVEELVLQAPLALPATGALTVRLTVGAAADDGSRPLRLHSLPDDAEPGRPWTEHAVGRVSPGRPGPAPTAGTAEWPPPGAEQIDLTGLYEAFAAGGFAYGPLFQGLRAAWRRGEDFFAEAQLPAEDPDSRFGLHPALLDAALHVTALTGAPAGRMPFSWNGARLWATGATAVRLRLTPTGADSMRVSVTDPAGQPVLDVDSFALRPAPATVASVPLYRVSWPTVPGPAEADGPEIFWSDSGIPDAGQDVPGTVAVAVPPAPDRGPSGIHDTAAWALDLVQNWLDEQRFAGSRLILITRGAVAAAPDEDVPNLAGSAVWGLVRSAQTENPGRFVLLDLEPGLDSGDAAVRDRIRDALSTGEEQLALRQGAVRTPRLVPAEEPGQAPDLDPDGTVLITGGTGLLGSRIARHLVGPEGFGVRNLLLVSRSGPDAARARDLEADLTAAGARVRIVAADVADRDELAAVLADIPPAHPLTAVVHTAGALDDGVISSLTPQRLSAVLRPKVDAALALDELTRDQPLAAFVLFSSAAGIFGAPGQGNYAAANAVLDALAQHRRAQGRAGQSLAWTLWAERSDLTGKVGAQDERRIARSGLPALETGDGLARFDTALRTDTAALVPIRLDLAALRARAATEPLSPLLRSLVPTAPRRATAGAATPSANSAPSTLLPAGTDAGQALRRLTDLVTGEMAAVLGYPAGHPLPADRPFQELGFDSLASVDLRNRLNTLTGLRLPASLVFDYPTPAVLAGHLRAELLPSVPTAPSRTAPQQRRPAEDDPIVVVSMACRYPGGVAGPEDLWQLVESGTDAIAGFPDDRGWDVEEMYDPDAEAGQRGAIYNRQGGFLYDVADFDAAFFGISPREAVAMDPQQRILLETTWEAIERAGIDPATLKGSRTGVFAGVMSQDYAIRLLPDLPEDAHGFLGSGNSGSVISGRLSYTLGLEGPSVTVDTACSSSLVAVHLAAQALRAGECGLALAGGVTVMSSPELFVEFSRQGGIARDGRCKAYSQAADGTGFGEGVGVVLLERLSDATRLGHPVLAVLRGSAVNQDGASNGLTAPNGPSQQRVVQAALAQAGLRPDQVDLVEGHGTGTTLGDPIEAQALIAAYGRDRDPQRPLWLGSLKSNIGHTSAAAGVGGLIKTVMALRHGVLPPTLHVDEPSHQVDWSAGTVRLLTEGRAWPDTGQARRAGVSSFGMSGTNVHVVLESPAEGETPGTPAPGPLAYLLSARTPQALSAQAARLAGYLREHSPEPVAVGRTLATGRAPLRSRAVLVGDGAGLLGAAEALGAALGEAAEDEAVIRGESRERPGRIAFVFPGQGSQWAGLGVELIRASPVFAAAMAECEQALDAYVGWSLTGVLDDREALGRVDVVQPVLWAVMVSLARLWESLGVRPDLVVGHSQGEIAAAVVAGALSLDDGARVVALRSQALTAIAGRGGMVSIARPAAEVEALISGRPGLAVAVVNSPLATVVAGPRERLDDLLAACEQQDVRARRIEVDYASHSAYVDDIAEPLAAALKGLRPAAARVPMFSTVVGRRIEGTELDAGYWFENLRRPVGFAPAIAALAADGVDTFVEISGHPVLTTPIEQTLETTGSAPVVTGTLQREDGGWSRLLRSMARLWVSGVEVDRGALFSETGAGAEGLPTYAWEHERFWLEPDPGAERRDLAAVGLTGSTHPLLGAAVEVADTGELLFTGRLALRTHPWLAQHRLAGTTPLPGTALLEMALQAAAEAGAHGLEELTLTAALLMPASGGVDVQVRVAAPEGDDSGRALSVHSRPGSGSPWTTHATGRTSEAPAGTQDDLIAWPPAGSQEVAVDGLYEVFATAGYEYGPVFQGVRAAWRSGTEVYAEVELPQDVVVSGFGVHPALLDAALQSSALSGAGDGVARLPFSFSGVRRVAGAGRMLRVRVTTRDAGEIALLVTDSGGLPILAVDALQLRPLTPEALGAAATGQLLRLEWRESEQPVKAEGDLAGWARAGAELPELDLPQLDPAAPSAPETVLYVVAADGRPAQVAARVLTFVQNWLADEKFAATRLVVVTRGAVTAEPGEQADPASATVWGLLRAGQIEEPGRFVLLDLEPVGSGPVLAAGGEPVPVPAALATGEPQLARRGHLLVVPRLALGSREGELVPPADAASWRLVTTPGGTLSDLELAPVELGAPDAGQVQIEIRAAGVNFHDVVEALGLISDGAERFGGEAAGVVVSTGPGVSEFVPGQRVFGVFGAAFGNRANADAGLLLPIPSGWTFAEAAAVSIAALTAWHGLFDRAGLRAGERVLIHAGTGGVGTAAIQLARWAGAEVFATAAPAKWARLRELGLDDQHIASSRDLAFEAAFRDASGGQGLDVVLDCLTGDFVDASLRLLSTGGRFVELGRTDVRDAEQVGRDHPGVSYTAFDLGQADPAGLAENLVQIRYLVRTGVLALPTVTGWDIRRAHEAFRQMSQARHIGKNVLTVPAPLNPHGTVLITGGTGTLGAAVARHLVATAGVQHLVLVSRQGENAPGATELVAELGRFDAQVTVVAADVATAEGVRSALDAVPEERPLTALVHAAGVLEDAVIGRLTPESLERVLSVKVDAAEYLDRFTREADLSAFVLFSSGAGLLGAAGQANYGAANAALDALAARRRARGLPATAIGWGSWAQASGLTAGLTATDQERFARSGMRPLAIDRALELFDQARYGAEPYVLAADLGPLPRPGDPTAVPAPLRGMVVPATRRSGAGSAALTPNATNGPVPLAERLAGMPEDDIYRTLLELINAQVATVLGHGGSGRIRPERPFKELGFDSLTGVELRNRLTQATGQRLPAAMVFDYPTPQDLARHLAGRIAEQNRAPVSSGSGPLAELARLESALDGHRPGGPGDGEIAARLRTLLQRLGPAEAGPDAGDLEEASNDELFALIDGGYGPDSSATHRSEGN